MASRFERLFQRHAVPALQREFSVLVRFSRGAVVSDQFRVRRSEVDHAAQNDDYNVSTGMRLRTYVMPVQFVAVDGVPVEPKTGDRLIEGRDVWEILPSDETTQAVQLQAGGYEWIVTTKKVR